MQSKAVSLITQDSCKSTFKYCSTSSLKQTLNYQIRSSHHNKLAGSLKNASVTFDVFLQNVTRTKNHMHPINNNVIELCSTGVCSCLRPIILFHGTDTTTSIVSELSNRNLSDEIGTEKKQDSFGKEDGICTQTLQYILISSFFHEHMGLYSTNFDQY